MARIRDIGRKRDQFGSNSDGGEQLPRASDCAVNLGPTAETPHRVRVLHVAETIKGGIATYLSNVLPLQVVRFGRENMLVVIPADQRDELRGVDVPIQSFPRHGSRLMTALTAAHALRSQLRSFAPTVVHIHSSFAGLTCRLLLRWVSHRSRIVYCPHGWSFIRIGRTARAAEWVERYLSLLCDVIVCVSAAERSAAVAAGLPSRRMRVIMSGLPDRVRTLSDRASGDAPLRLLFVGRFDYAKGFDLLVTALQRVQRPTEVDVFGDSVLGEYSVGSLPGCMRLHGWQPFNMIEPYLQRCDALVMPSRWEGLPMAAIEAMRGGKAVIASRVGGLPELVEDGVTGCLVPPDDAAALAQVLDAVCKDRLAELGKMGRKRFLELFRVETCEANLADLYYELLSNAGTASRL